MAENTAATSATSTPHQPLLKVSSTCVEPLLMTSMQ